MDMTDEKTLMNGSESKAIVPASPKPAPYSFQETMTICQAFVKSGYFTDVRDTAQAMVKVLAGRELGLPPMSSMQGIYIVKGKPSLSANLMAGAVKRSGKYNYRVTEHTEKVCRIKFYEKWNGEWQEVGESTFTIEDAKKAETQNLHKYPRNMLFARAMSNGVKWFCPDVFFGPVYTPEELGEETDEEGTPLPSQSEVALPQPEPPLETVNLEATKERYRKLANEAGFRVNGKLTPEATAYLKEKGVKAAPVTEEDYQFVCLLIEHYIQANQPPGEWEPADETTIDADFEPEDEEPDLFEPIGVDTETGEVLDDIAHVKSQCWKEEVKVEKNPKRINEMSVGWRKQAGVPKDPDLWSLQDAHSYLTWLKAYQLQ